MNLVEDYTINKLFQNVTNYDDKVVVEVTKNLPTIQNTIETKLCVDPIESTTKYNLVKINEEVKNNVKDLKIQKNIKCNLDKKGDTLVETNLNKTFIKSMLNNTVMSMYGFDIHSQTIYLLIMFILFGTVLFGIIKSKIYMKLLYL